MRRKMADTRIDLRTTSARKSYLEFAALLGGYKSLSSFINEAAEKSAKKIFDEVEESRSLSSKDRDLVLKLLDKAPEPTIELKTLFDKISKIYQIDENERTIYKVDNAFLKKETKDTKSA